MGQGTGRNRGRRDGRAVVPGEGEPRMPHLPGAVLLPGASRRRAGDLVSMLDQATGAAAEPQEPGRIRYSPAHLARLLGLPEPTAEQAAVISAPMEPLSVIAGAGSGKSETMAARLVWLVANGMVKPERVLGLTFTRKAAGELGQRVRTRLAGLRRVGLGVGLASVPATDQAGGPLPAPAVGPPPGPAGGPLAGWAGGPPTAAGDPWAGRGGLLGPGPGEPSACLYRGAAAGGAAAGGAAAGGQAPAGGQVPVGGQA